jgi:c-di-GMP-related signal transduction protein
MMEQCLARQPIFDRNHMVIGYELLYQSADSTDIMLGNEERARKTIDSFLALNFDALLGGHIVFLPLTKEMLFLDTTLLLNKSTTIIEISRELTPTPEILTLLEQLKVEGFMIALSDYTYDYPYDELRALADIIMISLTHNSTLDIKRILLQFQMTTQVLLAKHVNTPSDYEAAKSLGFELFYGSYFSMPSISKTYKLSQSHLNNLEIIKIMGANEPDLTQIAKRIESDVSLTIKLLKLVNSTHSFSYHIQSVKHALAILGIKALRAWMNLAIMDELATQPEKEAIKLSMVRMRLLEVIGEHSNLDKYVEELKLIGILSVVDVLYHQPLSEALIDLPVEPQIKKTLLGDNTEYTNIYMLIRAYESARFDRIALHAHAIQFNLLSMPRFYKEAVSWADNLYYTLYPTDQQPYSFK